MLEFFTENKNCEKRKMGASVREPVVEVFCTILFFIAKTNNKNTFFLTRTTLASIRFCFCFVIPTTAITARYRCTFWKGYCNKESKKKVNLFESRFCSVLYTVNDLINAHSQINASYLKKKRPPMRCEVYITPPL